MVAAGAVYSSSKANASHLLQSTLPCVKISIENKMRVKIIFNSRHSSHPFSSLADSNFLRDNLITIKQD